MRLLNFIREKRDLCKKCDPKIKGTCCYYSIMCGRFNVILSGQPCRFLNLDTKECSIFKNRLNINPLCLPIKECIEKGAFPKGCRYVRHNKKYKNGIPKLIEVPEILPDGTKDDLAKINAMPHAEFLKYYFNVEL